MSDQHKPTGGECYYKRHNAHSLPHAYLVWKGDKPLAGPMQEKAAKESCDEINAALAAEREKWQQSADAAWRIHKAALAAERGELVELHNLVKINDQLREQLAAERNLREKITLSWTLSKSDNEALRKQLVDEREKAEKVYADCAERIVELEAANQTLVDALKGVDIAYQRVPDTQELRTCVRRGDFNELGNKIKEARAALEKVKL